MRIYTVVDLVGKVFGRWMVLSKHSKQGETRGVMWLCRCECGNEKVVKGSNLKSGQSISCGCSKSPNLVGRKFGRLTVLKDMGQKEKGGPRYYLCKCICGIEKEVNHSCLLTGDCKSCGCLQLDTRRKRPHEYAYNRLLGRAHKANIEVTLSYEDFLAFTNIKYCHYCEGIVPRTLYRNSGYYLDRKNNDIGYSKENCVVCCCLCNYTKGNRFTYEEFMLLTPILRQIRLSRLETL